jgi:hypothetical protein
MPSHREILQARLSEAEAAHRATSSEVERVGGELKTAQASIDSLQARYEKACRAIAEGDPKAEDPAGLLAQRDRESHRVRGLQVLHREALDVDQRAAETLQQASLALLAQNDAEELEKLEAAVTDSKKKMDEAQTALDEAMKSNRAAVWTKDQFRKKLERQARARAQGLA